MTAPQDPRGEQLAKAWQNALDLEHSRNVFVMSLPFQVVQAAVYYIFRADGRMVGPIMLCAAVMTVVNLVGLRAARRGRRVAALNWAWTGAIINTASNLGNLYALWHLVGVSYLIVAYGVWTALSTLLSLSVNPPSAPHVRVYVATCALLYALAFAFAPREMVVGVWFVLLPFCVATGAGWTKFARRQTHQKAMQEYERLRAVTPPAIIDAMIKDPKGEHAAFRPTLRQTVCICSDWRGYQKMTAGMSDGEVVAALEHYYNAIDRMLEASFPRGNYFSDWIADELFVVVFEVEGVTDAEMAAQATAFAADVVQARQSIAERHGVPLALDIGLSFGAASVGIMGSDRHRKATALGETPGRARRLQTAGKLLRAAYGDHDRVVVEHTLAELLPDAMPVRTHTLGAAETVQDIAAKTLHFLEPTAPALKIAA